MPKTLKLPFTPKQRQICSKLAIEQCLARRVLCICNVILTNPLFKDIERAETHKLSAIADVIKLQKNEKLFLKGSQIEHIYFVLEGSLKLYDTYNQSDKVFITQIASVGDAIGLESLFSELQFFTSNAETFEASTILILNRSKFKKLVTQDPVILQNLLSFISERAIDLERRLRDQILEDVQERLLNLLKEQSIYSNSKEISLEISKADLAYLLGTIPATLSRVIKKLEKQKLINVNKNSFTIRSD